MRVLLDATAIPVDRGGVGRYIDEIVPPLVGLGVDLVVVAQARDAERFGAQVGDGQVHAVSGRLARRPARLVWEQTGLPGLARRVGADVVHSPHYTLPVVSRVPIVSTLHDATFFSDPDVHLRSKALFFRAATRLAVRRSASLVVPSLATRDQVLHYAGGREEDFFVALHGVDEEQFHPVSVAEQDRVRVSLGIGDEGYVAFLGTLEPRKNVPALVRGWVKAVSELPVPPVLVLAGARGWDDEIERVVAEVPAHLRVLVPGYLPLEDLPGFLSGARVVLYPSLGEGFGLPVLEAMACGGAVLTTRRLSLPEVGGDAVAYCDVTPESIGHELSLLLADSRRTEMLRSAARVRAGDFTWERAARAHIEAYEHALRKAS